MFWRLKKESDRLKETLDFSNNTGKAGFIGNTKEMLIRQA
jgi:hypothetical protein